MLFLLRNYTNLILFHTQADLDNTIGQAADLGVSGIVMWGNRRDENTSPEICRQINDYIQTKLGPYFKNTELVSEKCSEERCSGNGRCIKENMAREFNIYQDDVQRKSCPGIPKRFSVQNRKISSKLDNKQKGTAHTGTRAKTNDISSSTKMKVASHFVDKLKETAGKETSNIVVQKQDNNTKLQNNDNTALRKATNPKKKGGSQDEGTGSKNNTNAKKYESKESIKDFATAKSGKMDRVPFLDENEEARNDEK